MCYGGRRNSLDPGRTTRVWNYTYFVNDRTQGRQKVCCRSVTNKKVKEEWTWCSFIPYRRIIYVLGSECYQGSDPGSRRSIPLTKTLSIGLRAAFVFFPV